MPLFLLSLGGQSGIQLTENGTLLYLKNRFQNQRNRQRKSDVRWPVCNIKNLPNVPDVPLSINESTEQHPMAGQKTHPCRSTM